MDSLASILLYVCVFAASVITVQYGYKHRSNTIQIFGLLLPVILGGLRYDVGLDYLTYLSAYADVVNPQTIDRYIGTSGLEYSFHIISYISNFFFSSPIAMYFIYCMITVFAFHGALAVMKPKNLSVALFLFYSIFLLNSFNTMRQGAAISLGCLAMTHYINNNKLKAYVYVLAAMIMHVSAVLLILYIMVGRVLEKKYILRRSIGRLRGVYVKTLVISMSVAFAGLFVESIGYMIYSLTGRIGEYDSELSMGVIYKYLLCVGFLYLATYVWKKFDDSRKRLSLLVAFGTVVYALGLVHNEAARIGMYLIVLMPILFAVTYDAMNIDKVSNKLLINGGVAFLSIIYVMSVHITNSEGVKYEYQSIIGSEEYMERIKDLGI